MQSIISGMSLLNLPAAFQNIVVGVVLVLAVWLDQLYSARSQVVQVQRASKNGN